MINIYVSNLSRITTTSQLEQIFGQYGYISKAKVVKDMQTGKSKQFGFVEMEDRDAGIAAIMNLDTAVLDGQNIRVQEAVKRDKPARSNNRKGGYNKSSGGYQKRNTSSGNYNKNEDYNRKSY